MREDVSRPLRVALLSYRSKDFCGGQGVYVRHLSAALSALGHDVTVVSGQPYPSLEPGPRLHRLPSLDLYREPDPFRTPRRGELRDWVDALEVATMWSGGFPEPLTFSLRAARLIRSRPAEVDVVHDNQSLGYGLLQLQRAGVPLVATVHHPITIDRALELADASSRLRRLSLRRWYGFTTMQRRVAQRLPALLTVSESSAADIVRDFGVRADAVRVVPIGVDAEVFTPPTTPRVTGRIAVVSSSDSPLKGLRVLLEAIAKLRTERDVELVVVGSAKPDGPVARAIDDLGLAGVVRFVTGISDAALAELLGSAQVAVVPSLYEGFSIPAVEAMACGTPLVASRAGALPEVVGSDGSAAVLVAPGDPSELAAALDALLADESRRRALGRVGRARVESLFTWHRVATATVEAYTDAIARTRHRAHH